MNAYAMHPSHFGPARVPWRMLLFCGTLAIVAVVVLAQFTDPGEPRGPDGILRVGDCVTFDANNDAREVACIPTDAVASPASDPATSLATNLATNPATNPATNLVVEAFVPFGATCPGLTEPHRDHQGMGVACIDIPDE